MSFLLLGRIAACDHLTRPVAIQGNKARALLALLLVRANHYVSTDLLEDELWDGAPPRGARSTVHAHISRLRSVIGIAGDAAVLAGRAGGYELSVDPVAIDVNRFEALATQGSEALARDPREAADLCARALDEWRGPALRDVRHLRTLQIEAERLDELRLATIETRMAAELHAGSHVMVVGSLQRLVDEHPLREQLRALLMLALHRSGRQVEALRAFQAGYAALVEVGLQPGRELRELEEAIGREEPSLLGPTRSVPRPGPVGVPLATEPGYLRSPGHGVLLIEGPDASGAVDALVASARRGGRAVLRGCDAVTPTRPYQSVADALAPLLDEAIEAGLGGALAPIVAPVAPAKGVDPAYQRFQAFEAVLELLEGRAARQPLVFVLDDVDRAGASTLDLLEHLARRGRPQAGLALVASRSARSNAALDAWLRRLERDGLVQRMAAGSADPGDISSPEVDEQPDLDHAALAADAFAQAAELSGRAGDDALLRLGFDEAADHYRAALTALDMVPAPQTTRRAELHTALGHACHAAYRLDDALASFRQAAAHAAAVGDVHLLAQAAVGVATATEFGMANVEVAAVLSGALEALPDESPVRVELLAGLARTLPGPDAKAIATARQAVAVARQLDSPRSLAIALATAVLVTWRPDGVASRLAEIDEVIARAERLEMVELAVEAHVWRAATLRQLGRDDEAAVDTAMVRSWAEQSRRPFFLALASMLSIADHLRDGRIGAADAALADLPSGAETSPNFSAGFAAQLFLLRRRQGRSDEFVPLFDMLADDPRAPAAWDAARVLTLAEMDHPSASDALRWAVARIPEVPEDWLWLATIALLADACVHLGDRAAASDLHRRLWPYRDQTVIVAHGVASLGPVGPRLDALHRISVRTETSNRLALAPCGAA